MADLFISYAKKDREKVEPIAIALKDQGWSVFWDRAIPGGKTWDEVIEEELDAAKCVVVVWSKISIKSRWVRAEAEEGLHRNILVPVSIEDIKIPLLFRPIQSVRLIHWQENSSHPQFVKLISDLSSILGPSPLKVKEAEKKRLEEERKRKQEEERKAAEEKRRKEQELKQKAEEKRRKAEAEEAEKETKKETRESSGIALVLEPKKSDRIELNEACEERRFWHIIYRAKRLLQIDSSDEDACRAIKSINPKHLIIKKEKNDEFEVHPLFAHMNRQKLQQFIMTAQLIEREDGDVICAYGDRGDTMFIVLDGQVGETMPLSSKLKKEQKTNGELEHLFSEGMILGDVAFALRRKHTATLKAVGSTALLQINYKKLQGLLSAEPKNLRLGISFERFHMGRILEHICHLTTYLSNEEQGPLCRIEEPWENFVDDSELISLSWDDIDIISPHKAPFDRLGLYILTSGRLTAISHSHKAMKILDGQDFPILFNHLPNFLVGLQHEYRMYDDSEIITIVRISDQALRDLGVATYSDLVCALMRQLSLQFTFDAFISYHHSDMRIAHFFFNELKSNGLKVYMFEPQGTQWISGFESETEFAISDSLVMVPLISSRVIGSDDKKSWVQREIQFRKTLFNEGNCNILPIELTPGLAENLADGFPPIAVSGIDRKAIKEIARIIRAVRMGEMPPPHAKYQIKIHAL